jgi:hypothetical protein
VKHPNSNKNCPNLKPSAKGLILPHSLSELIPSRDLCRIIIDLKVKNNSYNDIIDFCARTLQLNLNKAEIRDLILILGSRAKHLNGIYDTMIQTKCKILYLDEIFQGRNNCFLGCADSHSHYLFALEEIQNRSEPIIRETIHNLCLDFDNVQFVVTDGLPTYHQIVPLCFDGALHVLCQVHAYRIILREQDEFHRAAEKAKSHFKDAKIALQTHRTAIHKKQQALWRKKKRQARVNWKQQEFNQKNGIMPYAKKAPWTPERLALKDDLNNLQMGIKSQTSTIARMQKQMLKLQQNLCRATKEYEVKKQISLQTGRLVHQFHDLMKCDPREYPKKRERFQRILAQSKYPIAKKVNQFLVDHPELFITKTQEFEKLCPPTVATTNILENIFNIIRPFFSKARHFGDTDVSKALFEIVRLWYNTSSPYTGPNYIQSPLERAGIHPRSKNYLDLLIPLNQKSREICRILSKDKTRLHHNKARHGSRASIILARSMEIDVKTVN